MGSTCRNNKGSSLMTPLQVRAGTLFQEADTQRSLNPGLLPRPREPSRNSVHTLHAYQRIAP